jgi:hypothetical protein
MMNRHFPLLRDSHTAPTARFAHPYAIGGNKRADDLGPRFLIFHLAQTAFHRLALHVHSGGWGLISLTYGGRHRPQRCRQTD